MKSKKLFLPTVILIAAILLITLCSLFFSIAEMPKIKEGEFAFSITYELDGETKTIKDVYYVTYEGNGGYNDTKTRHYAGRIGNLEAGETVYVLKAEGNTRIELYTNFYPDYLMGDAEYDYFDGGEFEPKIFYYDEEETEYGDKETLEEQGVKLISFEYPAPIKNSFEYSHMSQFSSDVILPTLLVAALAWLMIFIFVKKDNVGTRKTIDSLSTVFNFIIAISVVPFAALCALLLDATGDNDHIIHQVCYFIPSLTVIGIAASVALRRKGYSKSALVVQFIAPVIMAAIFFIGTVIGTA